MKNCFIQIILFTFLCVCTSCKNKESKNIKEEKFYKEIDKISQKRGQSKAGKTLAINIYKLAKETYSLCPSSKITQSIIDRSVAALILSIETTNEIITNMSELAKSMYEYKAVRNMDGVGEKLAPLLIAEIGDIRRFKNAGSLIAYAGIDAPPYQSGKFEAVNRHISKRGNKLLTTFSNKSLPRVTYSSLSCLLKYAFILALACVVFTIFNQSLLGLLLGLVIIFTISLSCNA